MWYYGKATAKAASNRQDNQHTPHHGLHVPWHETAGGDPEETNNLRRSVVWIYGPYYRIATNSDVVLWQGRNPSGQAMSYADLGLVKIESLSPMLPLLQQTLDRKTRTGVLAYLPGNLCIPEEQRKPHRETSIKTPLFTQYRAWCIPEEQRNPHRETSTKTPLFTQYRAYRPCGPKLPHAWTSMAQQSSLILFRPQVYRCVPRLRLRWSTSPNCGKKAFSKVAPHVQ